jgi:hypothetical protein
LLKETIIRRCDDENAVRRTSLIVRVRESIQKEPEEERE